jgi:ferredoxin
VITIEADRELCVGAGMCVLTAAAVFDQSADDGRVVVRDVNPPPDLLEAVDEAARLCPSGAISITRA